MKAKSALFATAFACVAAGCGALLGIEDGHLVPKGDAGLLDVVAADGLCIGTDDDPKNCGTCGHDCLGGGCTKAKCQPVLLASNQTAPGAIATDGRNVFWANGPEIMSVPVAGGVPVPVTTAPFVVGKIVVAPGGFFFSGGASIASVADGGVATLFFSDAGPTVLPLAVDESRVYFADTPSIRRMGLDGTAIEVIAPLAARDVTLDATRVYFTGPGGVAALTKGAMDGGLTILGATTQAQALAIDAINLYWLEPTGSSSCCDLKRVPLVGGMPVTLGTCGPFSNLVADGTYVYCALPRQVVKVPVGGTPELFVTSASQPNSLAGDPTSLYFTTSDSGEVFRVAK